MGGDWARAVMIVGAPALLTGCPHGTLAYRGTVVEGPIAGHAFEHHDPPKESKRVRGVRVRVVYWGKAKCEVGPFDAEWSGTVTDAKGWYSFSSVTGPTWDGLMLELCFGAEGYETYVLREEFMKQCGPTSGEEPCYLNVVLRRNMRP
jgi:hypothetical protein